VLYMSGYGEDRAAPPSDLGDGFIQKPFSGEELARAVREVLDRRS
jgi:DNA-binding response OmpR family regulator